MWDELCKHGLFGHALIHEAAHAVAACDCDLRFTCVEVLVGDSVPGPTGWMAGGFVPNEMPIPWPDHLARPWFEVALAGCIAEEVLLECARPTDAKGDLYAWCHYFGVPLGDLQRAERVLGASFAEVHAGVKRWALGQSRNIRAVAAAIRKSPAQPTGSTFSSSGHRLSELDVHRVLDAPPEVVSRALLR